MSDKPAPDLHETAWSVAKKQAASVYRSPLFGLGATLVQLIVLPLAVLLADEGAAAQDQIAAAILAGAVALAVTFLSILVVKLALAPVSQRNELRREWPAQSADDPAPNVRLYVLDAIRRGHDLSKHGVRPSDVDNWTVAVFDFLTRYGTEDEAELFVTAEKWLSGRIKALEQIAEMRREP